MQRFLSRLTWNDLPLQIKTGLIFILQAVLITVMAVAGFTATNSVGTEVQITVATLIQLRESTQHIQLDVENLDRLQTDLSSSYNNPGFNPATSVIPAKFDQLITDIEDDLGITLAAGRSVGGTLNSNIFAAQIDEVKSRASQASTRFNALLELLNQISTPDTGALAVWKAAGTRLQAVTLSLDNVGLANQVVLIRSLETTITESPTQDNITAMETALSDYERLYQTSIPEEDRRDELLVLSGYRSRFQEASTLLVKFANASQGSTSAVASLRSSASRLSNFISAQTSDPLSNISGSLGRARSTLILGMIIAILAGSIVTAFFGQSLVRSMRSLLEAAKRLQQGNLRSRAPMRGSDEFSQLGASFNAMATQLEGLITGLEQRVAERARDLSITADIGRAVVSLRDPRDLMNEIVELIRQRFGFYHAQVFLVDDAGETAMLVASTGTAGRELLARRHALAIGSQSVIGQVTSTNQPVIALDTDVSAVHRKNELLPDTRSEMALPMRIGDQVIGALDIQSVAPNAFEEDDIAVFQIMADQLAIALENARLFNRLQDAENNLQMFERRVTNEAWQAYREGRSASAPAAFRVQDNKIETYAEVTSGAVVQAIQSGTVVAGENGGEEYELALPIKVRGEVIGAFGFGGEQLKQLTDDDIALVEAVIDRVGLALENIRLVEQTSRRAEHEQVVNEITAKIVGSTDINYILQTTVKELGRVLRAPQTSVQLRKESE